MAISQIVTNSIATGAVSAADLADASVTNDKLSLSANASNIATALNATGSAPIYACRAWVNFVGSGTVAIRGSANVSSITDNGTGNYTVNLSTAMPDTNYSAVGSDSFYGMTNVRDQNTVTASSFRVYCYQNTFGTVDVNSASIAVFR